MLNKENKPINVYWSEVPLLESKHEVSFLYPNPKSLFSELMQKKINSKEDPLNSYFSCPAVSSKFKKILVLKNNMDCSYKYSFTEKEQYIDSLLGENHITAAIKRPFSIKDGPTILFNISYIFFADEPLEVYLTPPMFSEPHYTKYGSIVPGEFDIGQWFRPINFEVQTWKNTGEFHLVQNEPLMYLEFKTDRPINLKRFNMNETLYNYATAMSNSFYFFGNGKSLKYRYQQFKNVGYKSKIMKQIEEGLLDEKPYEF